MQTGITRRNFLKGAAYCAAGAAATSLLNAQAVKAEEEMADAMEIRGGDGKYVTKAMGHEDYIYVCTTLEDGMIKDCSVISHSETIGIGNHACARIPKAIVEHQSVNVPNLRGCSISSMAIKAAVTEALEQAGYDVEKFSAEVVEEDDPREETIDVDVAVVGAGTAGLIAASRLLDMGYSVAVVEKRGIPGGSGSMTYSGIMGPGTSSLHNWNVDGSVKEHYLSPEAFAAVAGQSADPEKNRFGGECPYQYTGYAGCAEIIDYFTSIGIGFCTIGSYEASYQYGVSTYYLAPGCYMGGSGFAMMALADRIERQPEGQIFYMMKCTGLIQDAPGEAVKGITAVGVKADDSENGHKLTINSKAVILASGGFARNPEMLAEYTPTYANYFYNCNSASTGEGIQMGIDAGSKVECMDEYSGAYLSSASMFELAFLHYSTPGIMVDAYGKNVGNITSGNHNRMRQCLFDLEEHGGQFWYIFDESSRPSTDDFEMYNFSTYSALANRGELIHFDSIEACAEELGLDGLADAIKANNEAAMSGEPDEFGRKNCPLIDDRYGIYAIPVMPTLYLTTAGICIDPQGRVLTDSYVMDGDNVHIPGLYAAGDVCGSVEQKDGKNYGMGFDMALGFGYTVAKTIADDGIEPET